MIFCEHCVGDAEISSIIRSVASRKIGCCPTCHANLVCLYDTEAQNELTPYFEDLISIYSPVDIQGDALPYGTGTSLVSEITKRWRLFPGLSEQTIQTILTAICKELYDNSPQIFNDSVCIPELFNDSYLRDNSLLLDNDWNLFVDEIKTKNRYHSRQLNSKILEEYCAFIRKDYKAGTEFYRGRISDRQGYGLDKMSAPPVGKSAEGRANARGITCLYVASDIDTAFHEVRAGLFDYVSVGKFRLKHDITVVDLSVILKISPFNNKLDCLKLAINKPHLERLNHEMSRPLRRSDSTLDYVPTQYIVDYIKSIETDGIQEYNGIEYTSTANPSGYNLAIFDPDLFECTSVTVYEIEKLQYGPKAIL